MKVKILLLCGVVMPLAPLCSRAFASPSLVLPPSAQNLCAPTADEPNSIAPGSDTPDVILERLDDEGRSAEEVGEQIINDDPRQTLASVLSPEKAQLYLIHIKNRGQNSTTFRVFLGGLLSPTGTETLWSPSGWAAYATLDGQTTNILTQLKSKQGWETPRVNGGEEAVVRLSLTAPTMNLPTTDGSFRIVARQDDKSDAVIGRVGPQFIAKIQWTPDQGKNWLDVTDTTMVQILHNEALGVRAIKAVPSAPWGDNIVLGPKWTFQATNVEGEEVWLQPTATALTGATVTATLGNSKSFQARVLPDPYVTFTIEKGYAVLPANAAQTQPCQVSLTVEDEEDKPLAQMKVRLRAYKAKTALVSSWTPQGQEKATKSAEEILLTNQRGEVQVQWSAVSALVSAGDSITFKAEVIDEEGTPFGANDTFKIRVYDEDLP